MSPVMQDRVLALAGLAQALQQVRRIAETGQSDAAVVATAIDSVFRIDAESPLAIYGNGAALRPGLRLVREYLGSRIDDPLLPKLALAVMQIERRFVGDAQSVAQVQRGIASLAPAAERLGSTHPDILAGLGSLYAETISQLRPRVMVQGNPHYLGQPNVVAEIRSILLAALRSAVLWRQLGGSYWDLLLRRRELLEAAGE
ncbi:high frequency lysogenization protein [Luteimonas cucumeris]|uniref:High frequency lysogenization protein HflD homolog n=1 Tax=Luteimonas cucumeris TaxID=985012 RepID=A0A562L869_9GAMM|nr:high frequency lysogenization protein HflD [Luteimonas cucumeris]TWI03808.1 high frequency lysogenization protein [Luteimonas cucumeris]